MLHCGKLELFQYALHYGFLRVSLKAYASHSATKATRNGANYIGWVRWVVWGGVNYVRWFGLLGLGGLGNWCWDELGWVESGFVWCWALLTAPPAFSVLMFGALRFGLGGRTACNPSCNFLAVG